ncbi:hypothetical protein [Psychrobacter lutiphocae]|uniref:hypothetical protein n=1 Tax=Psychrobacter lutiphocae TaxID=540500 RepID=UPI001D114FEB|nr:hypothetical protein [Psychrobacter lutiphocae]
MFVVNSRPKLVTNAPLSLLLIGLLPANQLLLKSRLLLTEDLLKHPLLFKKWQLLKHLFTTATPAFIACVISILCGFVPSPSAHAHDALKMTLTSSKVIISQDGSRSYIPVRTAKVGTLIQYKATYNNTLGTPIQNTTITLPIPTNTEFNGEAYPPSAQASIDYYNYQDIPLRRVIEGKIVDIPFSEYKSLRWNIKYIPARKSINVAFNTIVN